MIEKFNGKVNLNIAGVVNPNIPYWQFNAVLPTYEIINEKESLKEKQYVTKSTQFYGNKNFYENFLKIPFNRAALIVTEEFLRLTNEGVCSLITTGVTDYFRKTKYNADDYNNSLRKVIEQKIDFTSLSSTARTDDILIYVRDIFYKFIAENHEFYKNMYDLVVENNEYIFSKLDEKKFNLNFSQTNEHNSRLYENLPDNRNYFDYLRLVGVPQDDINTYAQEEAEKENNTGDKKGTNKTTTNSNKSRCIRTK